MAAKYFFFTGTAYWAKVQKPDEKYGTYVIDHYLDEGSWKKFEESGLKLDIRTCDDPEKGLEGQKYVRFRRDPEKILEGMSEKPKVVMWDSEKEEYTPYDGLIGNGSMVQCKVQVYDTQMGKGHRLEAVGVEVLVPYEGSAQEDMPF